jgi:REP element-mobilizing transposase RayT
VLNRAVGRATLFAKATDYEAFVCVLSEALDWVDIRLLVYCVMPNHWHLVAWPQRDGDLSVFMRWLTLTHTQRWHANHHTQGTGPLYQGRFKAFPVAKDEHCLRVLRYVERNPLRWREVRVDGVGAAWAHPLARGKAAYSASLRARLGCIIGQETVPPPVHSRSASSQKHRPSPRGFPAASHFK